MATTETRHETQTENRPGSGEPEAPEELIRLEADFAEGGEFGRRVLVVTQAAVQVLEANGRRRF